MADYRELVRSLDADQRAAHAAVLRRDADLRIAAGAGSGKTRVVTAAVVGLLDAGLPPDELVVTTFTRAGSNELQTRLTHYLPRQTVRQIRVGTFHALALRALTAAAEDDAKWGVRALDMGRCLDLPKRDDDLPSSSWLWRSIVTGYREIPGLSTKGLNLDGALAKAGLTPGDYALQADVLRSRMIEYGSPAARDAMVDISRQLTRFGEAWRLYVDAKTALGAWDFADALWAWYRLLRRGGGRRATMVLVDESQDNSLIQLEIARQLACDTSGQPSGKLVLVGDARQSIYSWRGAEPEVFNRFQGATLPIRTNYRSNRQIVTAGNLIAHGQPWHIGGDLLATSDGEPGAVQVYGDFDSPLDAAANVSEHIQASVAAGETQPDAHAVLVRTNALVGVYEVELLRRRIPCAVIGNKSFFAGKNVLDYLAYVQLYRSDSVKALGRVINTPKRFLGPKAVEQIDNICSRGRVSLVAAMRTVGHKLSRGSSENLLAFASWLEALRQLPWGLTAEDDAVGAPEAIRILLSPESPPEVEDEEEDAEEDPAAKAAAARKRAIEEGMAADFDAATRIAEQFDTPLEMLQFALTCANNVRTISDDTTATIGGRVTLATIHRSKGLEWDHVYSDWTDTILPIGRAALPAALAEERRLAYVAITRARHTFRATWARMNMRRKEAGPSPFLASLNPVARFHGTPVEADTNNDLSDNTNVR